MLDWIFEGIVGWVASIVSQAMDAVSALFLEALGTDMTAMEEYFPFVTKAFDVIQVTAWAILILITVWQLFRAFGGPITPERNFILPLKNLLRIGAAARTRLPVNTANGIIRIPYMTGTRSADAGLKCSWLRQTVWSFPTENGSQWTMLTIPHPKATDGLPVPGSEISSGKLCVSGATSRQKNTSISWKKCSLPEQLIPIRCSVLRKTAFTVGASKSTAKVSL